MAPPLITPKSPRRRLFDDEIMAQIGLRSAEFSVRQKRRRFSSCARIALLLLVVALIARTSTYYILMNRDTPSTNVEEQNTESHQSIRRDAGTTISESYCVPESNVVANPMFVDFEHWDMSSSSERYNSTYWMPDDSPAGAYMHSIPESKYEDGDYPFLVQKITLVPAVQYNVSLSTQFKPIKFDKKQYYVSLMVAADDSFHAPIYAGNSFASGIMPFTNGTFFGTFAATARTAYLKMTSASPDYDLYFHKLTIYPSHDTTCGHQDPVSPLELIGLN
ncbi:hypothetical protein POJ06DRAFT_52409 [Lipomyces tetrasporus]|uniref:Uncharacterized protein n=1 Tax=Lipomyces tetrasporus TaxID=54092 RepID=A0AAD7QW89_9ASCO|nr:uncharacterized protein POJ06DRAFT_52409 [Lipomyces tetrasporus]KAJ8102613.1 hypothetical protein POJ06DRAFT_52409 [Lipomyces tetrasporus]